MPTSTDSSLMIYVIIVILYLEIFLFMFNPKINTQILFCAVPVTIILFTVILSNAIKGNIILNHRIVGFIIGIMAIVTCIGILNTAITKYKTDVKSSDGENVDTKLSKSNKNTVENIKIVFITNVIVTTILGFIISPDTGDEIEYIKNIYNSVFNAEFNSKTDAIRTKIGALFTWLYSYSWFIMAPVKYVGLLIYWLINKLFNIIYENKLAAGATYVFASSTYIIFESTRLSRLVIPE